MIGKGLFLVICTLFVSMLVPEIAMACEHCYGAAGDNAVTRGIGLAMGALIGVTGFIGMGTFAFFRKMTVRARLMEAGYFEIGPDGDLIERDAST